MRSASIEESVGAQLVVGLPGPEISKTLLKQLRSLHVRQVILFSRNIVSLKQVQAFIQQLRENLDRSLLVMVDHEGGRVDRFRHLRQGLTHFPDAMSTGATQTLAAVKRQGKIEAEELKRLGIRINLAPCVDVRVEGSDFVIGDRSYGSQPHRVRRLAVARIRGLQSQGVAACAKHFPGLGAVPRDPHRKHPTITLSIPEIERVHLAPFYAAIQAGVSLIMSSHVCYPMLGDPPGLPATFSRRLIHDRLRKRMRFCGLVISDDLQMGALSPLGDLPTAAIRAIEAGHDWILICKHLADAQKTFDALCRAYGRGHLSQDALDVTMNRIERFHRQYNHRPIPPK